MQVLYEKLENAEKLIKRLRGEELLSEGQKLERINHNDYLASKGGI